MDDQVSKRIKKVREALEINQRDFSGLIMLSSGYIAGIESNVRKINGRLIKLICSTFGVNEIWLKTGEGEMFNEPQVDEKSTKLLSLFRDLPVNYQDAILAITEQLRKLRDINLK
jgi:transcriptional regulator with XRE-family HTH domain